MVSVYNLKPRTGLAGQFKSQFKEFMSVIYCMVFQCAGTLKPGLSLDQLQQI